MQSSPILEIFFSSIFVWMTSQTSRLNSDIIYSKEPPPDHCSVSPSVILYRCSLPFIIIIFLFMFDFFLPSPTKCSLHMSRGLIYLVSILFAATEVGSGTLQEPINICWKNKWGCSHNDSELLALLVGSWDGEHRDVEFYICPTSVLNLFPYLF